MATTKKKLLQDRLEFAPTVKAVVKIIRNPDAKLPLVIAVNGTWGKGKSSLMSLIKDELRDEEANHLPVFTSWYNAWHLDGEQNLLTSFMRNIINAYERHYWFVFRFKLLWIRLLRLPWYRKLGVFMVLGTLVPAFFAFLFHFISPLQTWLAWLKNIFDELGIVYFHNFWLYFITLTNSADPKDPAGKILITLGLVVSVLISIIFVRRELMPSGLGALFELLPIDQANVNAEKQPLNFRDQFKLDFWDIVEVGEPNQRLVVFIDDIDRVSGAAIYDLLRAMNIISDNASRPEDKDGLKSNLVFIIGMASNEVARNLGSYLNSIAKDDMDDKTRGMLFIEKIVDLMIAVPSADISNLFLHPEAKTSQNQ